MSENRQCKALKASERDKTCLLFHQEECKPPPHCDLLLWIISLIKLTTQWGGFLSELLPVVPCHYSYRPQKFHRNPPPMTQQLTNTHHNCFISFITTWQWWMIVVRDKVGRPPGELGVSKSMECDIFPSVLWHCWLGDRKGIQPVKNWMSVCWWWFDWSFARLIAPVVQLSPPSPSSFASINAS